VEEMLEKEQQGGAGKQWRGRVMKRWRRSNVHMAANAI
jgi:hypothetical protein